MTLLIASAELWELGRQAYSEDSTWVPHGSRSARSDLSEIRVYGDIRRIGVEIRETSVEAEESHILPTYFRLFNFRASPI